MYIKETPVDVVWVSAHCEWDGTELRRIQGGDYFDAHAGTLMIRHDCAGKNHETYLDCEYPYPKYTPKEHDDQPEPVRSVLRRWTQRLRVAVSNLSR